MNKPEDGRCEGCWDGDALVQVAFGCPAMHISSMWVCMDCADWWRDAARVNDINCPKLGCALKCIEFVERRDGGDEIPGIAMAGSPGWEQGEPEGCGYIPNLIVCRHPAVTDGKCDTCGDNVNVPRLLDHDHKFTRQPDGSGLGTTLVCVKCGMRPYQAAE